MVWLGPSNAEEMAIYRPVLRAQDEERARLRELVRAWTWQAQAIVPGCVTASLVLDGRLAAVGPLVVFAVGLFDFALLLRHHRSASTRIESSHREARRRIAEHQSSTATVRMSRCPVCSSTQSRPVPVDVDGNVVFLRVCDLCTVSWGPAFP